ncbi:ATP-dependent DNA helicase RecQ-like isoform X2 [Dysidea avara]|uniref:ATP-dependent DNA helicase RecQ-like isoform X2 n=1 Tax=Dysidea avara TaxID=196820 RepID=UPI0033297139
MNTRLNFLCSAVDTCYANTPTTARYLCCEMKRLSTWSGIAVSKAVSEQSCDQCGNIIASNSTLRMKKRRQKKSYNLVHSFSSKGIPTGCVSSTSSNLTMDGVRNAKYQLVFFTPEAVLHGRWRKVLHSEPYATRLCVMVIDEAHTVIEWGDTFHSDMLRLGEIRSIVPEDVRFMAMTETASKELRMKLSSTIVLINPTVIAISPCKSNISYNLSNFTSISETFGPGLHELRGKLTSMDRVIIIL